jgi:hypothetical protein
MLRIGPVDGVSRTGYRPGMGLVISNLSVDCAEPRELASWWAEALGWHIVDDPDANADADANADDDEVGIVPSNGCEAGLLFLRVPETKSAKNRLHLDVRHESPPKGPFRRNGQMLAFAISSCTLTMRSENAPLCRGGDFRSYRWRIAISAANSFRLR